jgi:hypothetical protein
MLKTTLGLISYITNETRGEEMKKVWMISAVVVVVIGTTLLLVFSKDKSNETSQKASSGGDVIADSGTNKANPKAGVTGNPISNKAEEKQEETIEEVRRMFKPEWEKVNQLADKRLSELVLQAQKEYKTKKERKLDVSRLEGKYRDIYNDYEQDTKTRVDSIIASMQKEVIEKDLNNNISDEYFELYRIQKEKRIEKVMSELKKLS